MDVIKKIIKKENGLAMPLVLIVMIVLTLLGTALWYYSFGELNQARHNEDKTRAYYLARSGAESLAEYIRVNPEQIGPILGENQLSESDWRPLATDLIGDVGEVSISLERLENGSLIVIGTGKSNGIIETAQIVLDEFVFDSDPVIVVTGNNPVAFDKKTPLSGSVIARGAVTPPEDFNPVAGENCQYVKEDGDNEYTIYCGEENYPFPDDYFKPVVIPDGYREDPDVNKDTLVIEAGDIVYISSVQIQNDPFIIKTAANTETILIVDSMELKVPIQVTGNGQATIYVRNDLNMQTSNVLTDLDPGARLTINLYDSANISLTGNAKFEGLIYGPDATMVYQLGNSTFLGAMIVKELKTNGNNPVGGNNVKITYDGVGFADELSKPIVSVLYWMP